MNINHISISRESLWNECHQKYKYKYHLGMSEKEQEYFLYGSVIHKILEEYILKRGKLTIVAARDGVLSGDIPLDEGKNKGKKVVELSPPYMKQINQDLTSFMTLNKKIGLSGECEVGFDIDLDPPSKKILTGKIDRIIDNGKGQYYIIDYKTTKKSPFRKDQKNIAEDLQLQCYVWVLSSRFDIDPKNIRAGLMYLQGATIVGAQFSKKTIAETPKRLLDVYNSIQNSDPEKVIGNVGNWCKRCSFNHLCPFYAYAKQFGAVK